MKKHQLITAILALVCAFSVLFALNASAASYSLGDISGDGRVTSVDARIALRCAAKLERLTEARTLAADADRSGKVNSTDARILLRVAAKMETLDIGENDVFEEPDVVRALLDITDDVVPLNVFSLDRGRVAVYCAVPYSNAGDLPDEPDEHGAYGSPLAAPDEADDPVSNEGEGDFSALDEDGRDPAEIQEGDFPALDEDGRDPAETGEGADGAEEGAEYVYIVDIEKNELLGTYNLPAEQTLFCIRRDGTFVTMYWMEGAIRLSVLDGDMQTLRTFDVPSFELRADTENVCIYAYAGNGSVLERWSFDGDRETVFSLPGGMAIADYDPDSGIAAVMDDSALPGVSQDLLLYDSLRDEFIGERPAFAYSYEINNDLLFASCNIPLNDDSTEYYSAVCSLPVAGDGVERVFRTPTDSYSICCRGTPYAFTVLSHYDWGNDVAWPSDYYLTDTENGRITLPLDGFGDSDGLIACYAPEDGLLIAADCPDGKDVGVSLYTIDPAAAQFVDALEPVSLPVYEQTERPVAAGWEEVRAEADAIEEDFGLKVYIGDQTLDYQNGSGYVFVSMETPDPDNVYNPEGEYEDRYDITPVEETDLLLDVLRRGLEKYPDGFFEKFRNSRGQGGVRIMLVRELTNPDGEFLAGGVEYKSGAWYNVAISLGNMYETDTIHHELWHAAQDRIDKEDYNIFSDATWAPLNPEGFEYTDDPDNYYDHEELFDWTIPWDNDASKYDDVWFARIYSTVTGNEDRATLIEALTSENYFLQGTGYTDPRDWIAQMPHLQAKLDYMAAQSERVFGYVYWDTILERMPKG